MSKLSFCLITTAASLLATTAHASPSHCIALYGACKYAADFKAFDYVNPDAPKGGQIKLAETGTFDSLNPYIIKGVKAPGLVGNVFQSLMTVSFDEPQSMYGLIAESIDVAPDHGSVTFVLRKEAQWQDGTSITADDVVFSLQLLKEKGDPTFKILYAPVASAEKTGERSVIFHFTDKTNRELPMIAASMPILSKAFYTTHDFEKTTLEPPLGSGPYKIASVEQGRSIVYQRTPNYWGRDLPVSRGQYNFDSMRYDIYRDENVTLEALKAGEYDFRREYIARNWATAYESPAIKSGKLIKRAIPDATPQGMQAFVFNTRKPQLADPRVREAIDLSLDYEWLNKSIFYGAYDRNKSFFENTDFQATGIPSGKELALLKPFADELPSALFTQPFANPVSDGSGNNRENLLKAQKLLEEAGWQVKEGKRVNAKGELLTVEFLLRQPTLEKVINIMRKNLERLGIASSIRMVDDSQYQKRTDNYDFDITSAWLNRGVFFPGNEQLALWASTQAGIKGGNNLSGAQSKAVDSLLATLTTAKDLETLEAAGRALDRVLLWEHYVIPNWHSSFFRVAYWDKFGLPKTQPKYNLGLSGWWAE